MPHFDLEVDVVDVVHCGGKIRVSTHLPAAPRRPRDGVATAQLPATGSRTSRGRGFSIPQLCTQAPRSDGWRGLDSFEGLKGHKGLILGI